MEARGFSGSDLEYCPVPHLQGCVSLRTLASRSLGLKLHSPLVFSWRKKSLSRTSTWHARVAALRSC